MRARAAIAMLLLVGAAIVGAAIAVPGIGRMPAAKAEETAEPAAETAKPADATERAEAPMQKAVPGAGLTQAAENEYLVLYFDNDSGGVAVKDKATGAVFRSNPPDALEDPKASDETKQELMSQVSLVYHVNGKEGDAAMNSYAQAMKAEQIEWGKLERGMRIRLTMGREEQRMLLPRQMTAASFERDILERIGDERRKRQTQAFYIRYSRDDLKGANGKELLAKYPILEQEDIYVLKSSVTDRDKRVLESYVKETGYTYEMMEEEYAKIGYEGDDAVFPFFKMTIDYELDGRALAVSLNAGEIEYDRETFSLVSLSLLNYFGAGRTGEDGYILLPDGSGTLIRFNNDGRKTTLLTAGKLYGPDYGLAQNPRGSIRQEFRAPVFGIKRGDSALLAVIEEGAAAAEINGVMGDINHSWNTAYATFTIRNKDWFIAENAFEQAPWILYEKNAFEGRIAMRYFFLTEEEADYVGMAKTYRQYLVDAGALRPVEAGEGTPFYLDTIGAVDTMVRKLGLPVNSKAAVTSFAEAGRMIERLTELGVRHIKLRYTGWYNGGYDHTAPYKLKVERSLGGERGLRRLAELAETVGAQLFPDADFVYVSENRAFDGFSPKRDAIRNLFQKTAYRVRLNPASLEYEGYEWVIDPGKMPDYFRRFSAAYDGLGLDAISLSTLGEGLHANYKNNNRVNRPQAERFAASVLAAAAEKYGSVMADYGNAYIYPYADHILRLPDTDSSYAIADEQVPFLQIALSGYVRYAGEPLNLASELRPAVLRAIEYGSGVYFKLNGGDGSLLKGAKLSAEFQGSPFDDWAETAADVYAEIAGALGEARGRTIENHERLAEGVYRTTFGNGRAVVVNYSDQAYLADGIRVEPLDYAVVGP